MATPRIDAAFAAAVACARNLGLDVRDPVTLKNGSNLLVHLRPARVVARVATRTARVRPGDAWLAREVAVAGFLAAAGEAVVAPSDLVPACPHHRDGFALTFWEYAPLVTAVPDPYEAGRRLRACHEALRGYKQGLPPMGALEEARSVLERLSRASETEPLATERDPALRYIRDGLSRAGVSRDDLAFLESTGERVAARVAALDLPLQPIHGDAHLHNVIETAAGPLWSDWEDAFLGPTAWDLACLYAPLPPFGDHEPARAGQAYRGYGAPVHADVLRALVGARRFQMLVWGIVLAEDRPERQAWVRERIAWLRERAR